MRVPSDSLTETYNCRSRTERGMQQLFCLAKINSFSRLQSSRTMACWEKTARPSAKERKAFFSLNRREEKRRIIKEKIEFGEGIRRYRNLLYIEERSISK